MESITFKYGGRKRRERNIIIGETLTIAPFGTFHERGKMKREQAEDDSMKKNKLIGNPFGMIWND